MEVYGFIDPVQLKKERQKAREMRKSQWWKKKLGERKCYYCEKSFEIDNLSMDHKVPLSRGGKSNKGNVVPSCKQCNNEKKYYTPAEMLLK